MFRKPRSWALLDHLRYYRNGDKCSISNSVLAIYGLRGKRLSEGNKGARTRDGREIKGGKGILPSPSLANPELHLTLLN